MFSPRLLEHFQNPRNVGELPSPAVAVEVSNPVCGDVLRLSVRVEGGIVRQVRFRASGCTATLAMGSALTEIVTGAAVTELRRLEAVHVEDALGGLPPASRHAADLAIQAIKVLLLSISS